MKKLFYGALLILLFANQLYSQEEESTKSLQELQQEYKQKFTEIMSAKRQPTPEEIAELKKLQQQMEKVLRKQLGYNKIKRPKKTNTTPTQQNPPPNIQNNTKQKDAKLAAIQQKLQQAQQKRKEDAAKRRQNIIDGSDLPSGVSPNLNSGTFGLPSVDMSKVISMAGIENYPEEVINFEHFVPLQIVSLEPLLFDTLQKFKGITIALAAAEQAVKNARRSREKSKAAQELQDVLNEFENNIVPEGLAVLAESLSEFQGGKIQRLANSGELRAIIHFANKHNQNITNHLTLSLSLNKNLQLYNQIHKIYTDAIAKVDIAKQQGGDECTRTKALSVLLKILISIVDSLKLEIEDRHQRTVLEIKKGQVFRQAVLNHLETVWEISEEVKFAQAGEDGASDAGIHIGEKNRDQVLEKLRNQVKQWIEQAASPADLYRKLETENQLLAKILSSTQFMLDSAFQDLVVAIGSNRSKKLAQERLYKAAINHLEVTALSELTEILMKSLAGHLRNLEQADKEVSQTIQQLKPWRNELLIEEQLWLAKQILCVSLRRSESLIEGLRQTVAFAKKVSPTSHALSVAREIARTDGARSLGLAFGFSFQRDDPRSIHDLGTELSASNGQVIHGLTIGERSTKEDWHSGRITVKASTIAGPVCVRSIGNKPNKIEFMMRIHMDAIIKHMTEQDLRELRKNLQQVDEEIVVGITGLSLLDEQPVLEISKLYDANEALFAAYCSDFRRIIREIMVNRDLLKIQHLLQNTLQTPQGAQVKEIMTEELVESVSNIDQSYAEIAFSKSATRPITSLARRQLSKGIAEIIGSEIGGKALLHSFRGLGVALGGKKEIEESLINLDPLNVVARQLGFGLQFAIAQEILKVNKQKLAEATDILNRELVIGQAANPNTLALEVARQAIENFLDIRIEGLVRWTQQAALIESTIHYICVDPPGVWNEESREQPIITLLPRENVEKAFNIHSPAFGVYFDPNTGSILELANLSGPPELQQIFIMQSQYQQN